MQLLTVTIGTSNLIEALVGIGGLISLIVSFTLYLAAINERQQTTLAITSLSARFQRLLDRNKGEIGILKMRMSNLEGFLKIEGNFCPRQGFLESDLPGENSDIE